MPSKRLVLKEGLGVYEHQHRTKINNVWLQNVFKMIYFSLFILYFMFG